MSKLEDKVNEILGIDTPEPTKEIVKQEFKPAVPRTEDKEAPNVDNDYKYSRENYYNLIERGLNPEKLILVGPGGLGAKRGEMRNMIPRHSKMSEEEIYQAHKTNLEILMMHDATKVDDWSVHIQKQNTDAHRIKSRPISSTDTLARILEKQDVPLFLLWGEKDASVGVYLEDRMSILRDINSKVRFHVEYNLGHWIMYENDVVFNKILNNFIQD